MQHGGQDKIKWFIQLSKELGAPVKALQDMPKLLPHLEPFMDAFDLLSGSRQLGFGAVGAIPLGDILHYLEWEGVGGKDEQRRWIRYIRSMDNAFLAEVNKK